MNKADLKLDWCSYRAAKYAAKHWHYSKSLAVGKMVKIGIWENKRFIGAITFNYGANPNLYKPYNIKKNECVELTRVAIKNHINPVTKLIKIAIKMLSELCFGLRLIVSFADPDQGHLGKIYQAGNWIYTGMSKTSPSYYYKNRWIHQRQLGSLGISMKDSKYPKRKGLDKFRYLYPLDEEMRERVLPLSKPYPKKISGSSDLADTLGVHPGKGGSIPTLPLQEIRATRENG